MKKRWLIVLLALCMVLSVLVTGAFAADDTQESPTIDMDAFLKKLIPDESGNITYDGQGITVKWSPKSACTYPGNHNCLFSEATEEEKAANGNTPQRLQGFSLKTRYCVQYQLCISSSSAPINDVIIKNVNFVYVPGDVILCMNNTGWSGDITKSKTQSGELQFQNAGNLTVENCTFENVILSPFSRGNATGANTAVTVADCRFSDIKANYAIKDIYPANLRVSNTQFSGNVYGDIYLEGDIPKENIEIIGNSFDSEKTLSSQGLIQLNQLNNVPVMTEDTKVTISENTMTGKTAKEIPILRQRFSLGTTILGWTPGEMFSIKVEKPKPSWQDITLPTLTGDENYSFLGWSKSKEATEASYPGGTDVAAGTYYSVWEKLQYTVIFDPNGGVLAEGTDSPVAVKAGETVSEPAAPTCNGYTFAGWYTAAEGGEQYSFEAAVNNDLTLYAHWNKNEIVRYTLHYESNGGTEYEDETYPENMQVTLDKKPLREGYTFTGWYTDKALTQKAETIEMTSNRTVYAGWKTTDVPGDLNGDEHFAYIIGYIDGTVRPEANISRAETAAIFFRLLKEETREANLSDVNSFKDVTDGMWHNTAISTLAKLGIVQGRSTEEFDPNAPITRAEFAAICARFDDSEAGAGSSFTDIAGHWGETEIQHAAALGWILGYEDGTFRPDRFITRAEAMKMINRVLSRFPQSREDLWEDMAVWPDNTPDKWYYLDVQEATNSHAFHRKDEIHETWTELTETPDWTQYQ